jgi:hypothetical protein
MVPSLASFTLISSFAFPDKLFRRPRLNCSIVVVVGRGFCRLVTHSFGEFRRFLLRRHRRPTRPRRYPGQDNLFLFFLTVMVCSSLACLSFRLIYVSIVMVDAIARCEVHLSFVDS